jgi:tRNA A-37 threonylcarbamoyl transferase component Bud32
MTAPTRDGLIAGRYQLVAPVGSGSSATVYRGLDILLDREVAVKQPILAATADAGMLAEAVKRISREARAAARINHPGVAAVYDVVSGEDAPYVVMQLIKGRPLAELLAEQGPLPPHRVADIGRQVLAALVAGHVVGVLHRDLKPGNVMITPDGRAVLTDFGIAATVGDLSIIRAGIVAGAPGYMAPERASGLPATPAADLWSLGATLYAALSGQGPFDDREDAQATLRAIASEDPPHLTGNGSLYGIVNGLLCRDPANRPTFHETAQALDVAAADAPATAGPPTAVGLPSATGRSVEPDNSPAVSPPVAEPPVAEPPEAVHARPWTAGDPYGEPWTVGDRSGDIWPADAGPSPSRAPAFAPPFPGENAGRDEGAGTRDQGAGGRDEGAGVRANRLGRASLILAVICGLGIVASAIAAFVPGSSHSGQTPPASAQTTPAPPQSAPAPAQSLLAGPPAPPPVGQQFRLAAAANSDGSPEVVAVASNGTLIASRFTNGSWSAWTTLPGGPAYTAVPAVAPAKDGRLIVFARARSGQVAEIWQASPGSASWQGPAALGTTITRSSPAVVAWPDGHLEVFALLSDAHVGYASQSSATGGGGGTWTGWTSLGGPVTGPPAVALDATGHPQVFAATSGRLLVHDYYLNGTWAGWAQAPGNSRYVGVPGIATNADGRLEVFARSTNGDLLHIWQQSRTGTRWDGPGSLAGNGCSTDPAAFSGTNGEHGGRVEAFCMDSNFGLSVFHTIQLSAKPGTSWSAWQSLKGSSDGAVTALQTPTVTEILTRTASGAFAYETWTAQHGWSDWSMLPSSQLPGAADLPGAAGGGDGGAGVIAALGVAEGHDTLGGVRKAAGDRTRGHHRVLAQGPAAAGRTSADYRIAPAFAGVGRQEGTGDDEAGDDEGRDAGEQQPAAHGAEGKERDRLDERAHPEDQHPADHGADRRHGQREDQVAAGPAVPAFPLRRLDQHVLVSGHTSHASSMPARLLPETASRRPRP